MFRLIVLLVATMLSVGCAQVPMTLSAAERPDAHPEWPMPTISSEPAPEPAPPVVLTTPAEPVRDAVTALRQRTAGYSARNDANKPPDVWQRIRGGFQMARMENKLVQDWENYYSSRPDYFARMIANSGHFLYHIIEEVERRGMPSEIALLPMIESAFNPVAYSTAHASGIWQFIPSTGKIYGLRQNGWYDGRRDVIAATGAALDYLQKLHGMFNDWELALASYNWGEGAVQRAVDRNQARGLSADYQSLGNVPAETRNYVPKLIAVKNIIDNPQRYGLTLAHVPNEPYFEVITVRRHIDVELAAQFAEMPLDEFRFLNPAHNKPVINADTAETIVLPRHKVQAFQANMARYDDRPLTKWQAHVVRAGERADTIAKRYDMTVAELNEINNIGPRRRIATGMTLLVASTGDLNPQLPELPAATPVRVAQPVRRAKSTRVAARPGARNVTSIQKGKTSVATKAPAKSATRKVALTQPVKKKQ